MSGARLDQKTLFAECDMEYPLQITWYSPEISKFCENTWKQMAQRERAPDEVLVEC